MTFVAGRSVVVNGAATAHYVVQHPIMPENNTVFTIGTQQRFGHIEVVNGTGSTCYIAFDRIVTPPSGTGVQGPLTGASYPKASPVAATPGDFDLAIPATTAWAALDSSIPNGSVYMDVYCLGAGVVTIAYGAQL